MKELERIQSFLESELTAMNNIITDTLHTPNELMNRIVTSYLEK